MQAVPFARLRKRRPQLSIGKNPDFFIPFFCLRFLVDIPSASPI
jgi:hypothetical protein